MKTLKNLKVGDECLIVNLHHSGERSFHKSIVEKVGRKWIQTNYCGKTLFCVERGEEKTNYSPMKYLYLSMGHYETTEGNRIKRDGLVSEIAGNAYLLRKLDTESLEKIVSIIRDGIKTEVAG